MNAMERSKAPGADEILGGYFPVLDHGFVSLVDYMGTDVDIERAARISYGAGTRKVSETRGLIRYLRRHAHTTPSEMVELKFHCSMPIFIARQWIRHRTASVNELSARYSLMPLLFYTPDAGQFSAQSATNNQGREGKPAESSVYAEAIARWEALRVSASDTYGYLIGEQIAREISRIDLPLSVYTSWYWKIDLHNLLHFLKLRVDPHAQWEIRQYGEIIAGMLERVAPLTYEAWLDYDVLGVRLSYAERQLVEALLEDEDGGEQDQAVMRAKGLSKREKEEFRSKLTVPPRPDFSLDLTQMRTAEEMEERMKAAVPAIDQN